ncbi:MAG: hypothetical protein ACYTFA_00655, partial [Planctomycetota bacterium]
MISAAHSEQISLEETSGWRDRFVQVALSLQCKATVLVVALTLTITAGVSGYFLHTSAKLARAEHSRKISQLAAMIAEASAAPMANRDLDRLEALAGELTDDGPMEYVIFTDPE